jgi:hypothetical protein
MRFRNLLMGPEAVVIAIDMRSSSAILDDLIIHSRLDPYIELLTAMKHQIADSTMSHRCTPYKFTGDGWLILFGPDTAGSVIYAFMRELSACYRTKSEKLLSCLNVRPTKHGLTFGIDSGSIRKETMFQRPEYIGQPIVTACRLQAACGRLQTPLYSAFVSETVFDRYLAAIPGLATEEGSLRIGTSQAGKDLRYKQLSIE